jgi:Domain of unknown function (DUF4281)
MDLAFSLSFLAVAPIWPLLLLGPAWPTGLRIVREPWAYAPLALLYLVLTAATLASFLTTFAAPNLESVRAFVTTDVGVTIGWVHWLVFDAFVGRWMVLDARDRGVPHPAVIPCLLLTLFAGPTGFLAYLCVRTLSRHRTPTLAG